jgi:hypothetical protein
MLPAMSHPATPPAAAGRAELRVTMPQSLYDAIRVTAEAQHRRITDWVKLVIERALANQDASSKPPRRRDRKPDNPMKRSKDPIFRKYALDQEARKRTPNTNRRSSNSTT